MSEQDPKSDKHELTKVALPALATILVAAIGAYATLHTGAKDESKPSSSSGTAVPPPPSADPTRPTAAGPLPSTYKDTFRPDDPYPRVFGDLRCGMLYDEVNVLKIGPFTAGGDVSWFELKGGPFKAVFVRFSNGTTPKVESLSAEARDPAAYTDVVRDAYLKLGLPKPQSPYSKDLAWGFPKEVEMTLGDGYLRIERTGKK